MSEVSIVMQIPCTTLSHAEVCALLGYEKSSVAGKEFPPHIVGGNEKNKRYHSFVVHQWLIDRSLASVDKTPKGEWSKHKHKALDLIKKKK